MQTWQIVLFAFFVLLPFALMLDFWPDRERLDYNGRPLPREWKRRVQAATGHDASEHNEQD